MPLLRRSFQRNLLMMFLKTFSKSMRTKGLNSTHYFTMIRRVLILSVSRAETNLLSIDQTFEVSLMYFRMILAEIFATAGRTQISLWNLNDHILQLRNIMDEKLIVDLLDCPIERLPTIYKLFPSSTQCWNSFCHRAHSASLIPF